MLCTSRCEVEMRVRVCAPSTIREAAEKMDNPESPLLSLPDGSELGLNGQYSLSLTLPTNPARLRHLVLTGWTRFQCQSSSGQIAIRNERHGRQGQRARSRRPACT